MSFRRSPSSIQEKKKGKNKNQKKTQKEEENGEEAEEDAETNAGSGTEDLSPQAIQDLDKDSEGLPDWINSAGEETDAPSETPSKC
jgi:hypothetical protein